MIEVEDSDIDWMEPRDLTVDQAEDFLWSKRTKGEDNTDESGVHYVTVRGELGTLDPAIDRKALRKLLVGSD